MLTKALQKTLDKHHRDHHIGELITGLREVRHGKAPELPGEELPGLLMLRAALQGAVTLEFATLPPYLSAIWSVKDELHPVARSLREILQEEMLHMALACNLLSAIGGTPAISTAVPSYPGSLPLGVHPELLVPLTGLTKKSLEVFLEIERPGHPGHFQSLEALREEKKFSGDTHAGQEDLTIGELYEMILGAFEVLRPRLFTDHQITGPLAWFVISSMDDVRRAVRTIQIQGEGSSSGPDSVRGNHAHYYRFAEMLEQKKLVYDQKAGLWSFETPFPLDYETEVWPVGEVPKGGYDPKETSGHEAGNLLCGFNETYSKLLDLLDSVWKPEGGQANFWHAVETMFALEDYARPLMSMQRPDGRNYCPEWKYIPVKERSGYDQRR